MKDREKAEKLLRAIGNISEELIAEAGPAGTVDTARPVKVRQKRHIRRWTAIAAAAALIMGLALAAGAGTGGFRELPDLFAPMFYSEPGDSSMELISRLGHPVGLSARSNGVTVTVESVLRDSYTCKLLLSIHKEGLDGNTLDFNRVELNGAQGGASWSILDVTPDDDTLQCSMSWDDENGIGDKEKMKLSIQDIVLNHHRFLMETTISGLWEIEFDTDWEDLSVVMTGAWETEIEGVPVRIDQVTISPLSAMVKFTARPGGQDLKREIETPCGTDSLRNRLAFLYIVITTKEGGTISSRTFHPEGGSGVSSSRGNLEPAGGDEAQGFTYIVYEGLLDYENIESITVEGIEIPRDMGYR